MIIIGSGSRDWRNYQPIRKVMRGLIVEFNTFTYFHGAQRGFDTISANQLKLAGHKDIKPFPADWDQYGKGAGPIRNKLMLDTALQLTTDILIVAMPLDTSVGTCRMIEIANLANVRIRIYDSNGTLV